MTASTESPSRPNPSIGGQTFRRRIGFGGFELCVGNTSGDTPGRPFILLTPGLGDEDAATRKPLAKAIEEVGITAGMVRHINRCNLGTATHARLQRSMDVHGAIRLVNRRYLPNVLVIVGHSFGGVNANDALNYDLQKPNDTAAPGTDHRPSKTILMHEATPGLGDEPFRGEVMINKLLSGDYSAIIHHPNQTAKLAIHEMMTLPQRMLGAATTISEYIAVNGVHIQNGEKRLGAKHVVTNNIYYEDDGVVPMTQGCHGTVLPGGHLQSYFDPWPLAAVLDRTIQSAVSQLS